MVSSTSKLVQSTGAADGSESGLSRGRESGLGDDGGDVWGHDGSRGRLPHTLPMMMDDGGGGSKLPWSQAQASVTAGDIGNRCSGTWVTLYRCFRVEGSPRGWGLAPTPADRFIDVRASLDSSPCTSQSQAGVVRSVLPACGSSTRRTRRLSQLAAAPPALRPTRVPGCGSCFQR